MPLHDALLPEVEVTVYWAVRRQWAAGDALAHLNRVPTILTLYLVEEGNVELTLDGTVWWLKPDDLFVVPPLAARDRIHTPQGATWLSLGIGPRLYGGLELAPLVTTPHHWEATPETRARVRALLDTLAAERVEDTGNARPRLARTNRARDPVSRLVCEGLARAVFGLWWRETRAGGAAGVAGRRDDGTAGAALDVPAWLLAAVHRMRDTPSLSLAEVQAEAGVSGTYLRRQFRHYFGRAPHAYLTECRLNAARVLLETTDRTVADVGTEVGFASLSHFTKQFAARYGTPPARFRQVARQQQTIV